jgi:uncharacterized membrane protein
MLLAAINDTPYDIVYLLHIIAVIVGTGAAFVVPVIAVRVRAAGQDTKAMDEAAASVMAPALLAAGVFGGALVGMSDDVYDFSQTWLALGGLVWLIAVGAAALAFPPSWSPLPDMSDKKAMWSGMLHLSLAAMLLLMTFKWGF